jgi:hypothetical protein
MFRKGVLEQFVVLHKLIIRSGFPIDFGHWDRAGKDELGNLTGNSSSRCLLNFGELQIEQVVQEVQKLLATCKVGGIHHT